MSDILGVRTTVWFATALPVQATATEVLLVLAGTRGNTTQAPSSTLMVSPGKTFRIERVWASYVATSTTGWARVFLRTKANSAISVGDPAAVPIEVGAMNPTTPNSSDTNSVGCTEGLEVPQNSGFGLSVIGMNGSAPAAVGYVLAGVEGFEY